MGIENLIERHKYSMLRAGFISDEFLDFIKKNKEPYDTLRDKNIPLTMTAIENNINDIAGVRIICSFLDDIYTLADCLINQDDITLIKIKDYVKNPKDNGYRSLHLIVSVPIFLQNEKRDVKVEVQLRTISMDSWASLEHKILYKKHLSQAEIDSISKELAYCASLSEELDNRMQSIHKRIKK